jgi:hypothetical protein
MVTTPTRSEARRWKSRTGLTALLAVTPGQHFKRRTGRMGVSSAL